MVKSWRESRDQSGGQKRKGMEEKEEAKIRKRVKRGAARALDKHRERTLTKMANVQCQEKMRRGQLEARIRELEDANLSLLRQLEVAESELAVLKEDLETDAEGE